MNQLKAGAVLNYCIIVLNALVGLLYTPYMLHTLGQSEYGLYSLVASVIGYLTILDLGFGTAIIRYTAKFRAEGKIKEQYEMFGMFLILYLVIGIIAFLAGLALYYNVDAIFGQTMTTTELSRARIMMLILTANLAITFPMSIFGSIMNAYERFVFPKLVNIIRVILNTLTMVLLLRIGYKAVAMVIVQTIFNILTLCINYIYCKKELHIEIHIGKFEWTLLKEVAIYSFWIFLNIIMDKIYWSSGQFILGAVSGTIAVAVFAVAIQFQTMYMSFSGAISSLFLPKITGLVTQERSDSIISEIFIRTGRIQNIVMILILAGFIVFGETFIRLWAGEGYEDSYIITVLFFVALYIPMIQNIGLTILQARNQLAFRSILYILIATCSLFAQYYLGKLFGGIGCAVAIAGALFIGQGIVMNIYYDKKQGLDIAQFWKNIIKMDIVPIIISIPFCMLMNHVHVESWGSLIIWIGIFLLVYLPAFYFFSMNDYERELCIKSILKKKYD